MQFRAVDVSTSKTYWIWSAHPEMLDAGGDTCQTTVTGLGYQLSVQSPVCPAKVHSAEIEFCACATLAAAAHTPTTTQPTKSLRTLMPATP